MKPKPPSMAATCFPRRVGQLRWLVGAIAWVATMPAAEPLQIEGPVVELPKFEVTDFWLLPPPEKWLYAEVPGFEILSRISERETKRFVRDFLLLQTVVDEIMPGLTRSFTPVPTALILCGRGKGFEDFLPRDRSLERYGTNSLFFRNVERAAIVIDFAIPELLVDNTTRIEADPYRAFYAAYFRFLIRRQLADKAPPWFEEGLVQLFAATEFDRKHITFAQIGDGFGAEKIGDFNRLLSRRSLMPLREMLAAKGPRNRSAFWSAQCYAFIHFCLYSHDKKYQQAFLRFVQRLDTDEPSEQLFKECFNRSFSQIATELRGYIEFTAYKKVEFRAKKGQELPEPPPVALGPAPDAAVGRIKGEVLRLGGHGDAARHALIAPYVRGERDPRLLAAIGLDEREAGLDARAMKFLEAATNAGVDRARAHLELARLRLDAAKVLPGAPEGRLSEPQVASVLTPLFVARGLRPPMAEVYRLIAEAWTLSVAPPLREHLAVILEGVRIFPRDTPLLMQATLLAGKRGFPAEAAAIARHGARVAPEPGDRDRFQLLASAYAEGETQAGPAGDAPTPETTKPYLLR